jgi:hypothetical protein
VDDQTTPNSAESVQSSPNQPGIGSVLRVLTELVAWVATPWALWHVSIWLAVVSVVILIGLPSVISTPGDKPKTSVAVPGWVTIVLVVMELAAAVISSWYVWPTWAAVLVTILAAACLVTEQPRWRWLLKH